MKYLLCKHLSTGQKTKRSLSLSKKTKRSLSLSKGIF